MWVMSSSSPWTRVTTLCTTCKSPARCVPTVVNGHLSPPLTVTPVCLSDSLYNTNSGFDWGALRKLEEELTRAWSPPSLFAAVLSQPGVYVFKLSSHPHRHMVKKKPHPCFPLLVTLSCVPVSEHFVVSQYVRVMPAGGRCHEPGPFFPAVPRHMTRMGIRMRRNLLLRPDWLVTGGLLLGAAVILCMCVSVLVSARQGNTTLITAEHATQ